MKGYIDDDYNTHIKEVYIIDKSGKPILIPTALDTGFNDEFCVPLSYSLQCKLRQAGRERYILGDGTVIDDITYQGEIMLDGQIMTVTMSITDNDEALIGNRLLANKVVTLDFVEKTISIGKK